MACWRSASSSLIGGEGHARYIATLDRAVSSAPDWAIPMAPLIEEQFRLPAILAVELLRHSSTEGIGARTIGHIGRTRASGSLRNLMITHAEDEVRHSKMFFALASHYNAPSVSLFNEIIEENEAFIEGFQGDLDWFLCDTHIAELRNLLILGMYVSAARGAASAEMWAIKTLEKIFDDEWRHVSYTAPYVADLLGRASENCDEFVDTFVHYSRQSMLDVERLRHSLDSQDVA
jgi:hypothetical protein